MTVVGPILPSIGPEPVLRGAPGRCRRHLLALVVVVVGAGGCSDEPAGRTVTATPSTSATASATPLTLAQYQVVLADVEQAVRPAFDRAVATAPLAEVGAASFALAVILEQQGNALRSIIPPAEAAELHRIVGGILAGAAGSLRANTSSPKPVQANSCGITPSTEAQLYEARRSVHSALPLTSNKALEAELTKLGMKFGEQLLPPEPVPPPVSSRRAGNGEIIQRAGPRGRGRLTINNGGSSDVAIAVTANDPASPRATIYVRGQSSATLSGIAGTYFVYFKSGSDWDSARRGFTRDCSFEKFDLPFDQQSHWEIELEETLAGNATTSTVPPF